MKRYFIISAILHIVVFTGLYFLPLLFIRGQESSPPPLDLVFLPPPEEVVEEDPTPEPTVKKTPSPEPTDYRSIVGELAPSMTPTPTLTPSKTLKPSSTPSSTPTPLEPTDTPTVSPTSAPPTETPVPATNTPTSKPTKKPTNTAKPTAKPTDTAKPTTTPKPTHTVGPTHSPTPDPTKQAIAKAMKDVVAAIKNAEKTAPVSPVPVVRSGVPGATGTGIGVAGEGNGLRTAVPFGDMGYLGRLQSLLQENFEPPRKTREGGKRTAVIGFKILKDGDIVDIEIVKSSGHKGIDRAAIKAVENSRPIDPLPLGTSDLGVNCDFVVE